MISDSLSQYPNSIIPQYITTKYGTQQLCYKGYQFNRHVTRKEIIYWRCTQFVIYKCRARVKTDGKQTFVLNGEHNHDIITGHRQYGSLKKLKKRLADMKNESADEILLNVKSQSVDSDDEDEMQVPSSSYMISFENV